LAFGLGVNDMQKQPKINSEVVKERAHTIASTLKRTCAIMVIAWAIVSAVGSYFLMRYDGQAVIWAVTHKDQAAQAQTHFSQYAAHWMDVPKAESGN